jgi:V/A-type H+-transporting ATPase subunit E
MTEKETKAGAMTRESAGVVVYDEKKKLSELQSLILQKGDSERERILEEARAEAKQWTSEQMKHLDAMVAGIKADAAKRSHDMTSRQLIEAETARDKDRLRLQNELIQRALTMLQDEMVAFDTRPDYDAILTGAAAEVCARLFQGQENVRRKLKMRLRAKDVLHGEAVAKALSARFPGFDIVFDSTPAPIIGGVFLFSEEEKWRVVADWKTKVEEMADAVAKAVLAEL